MNRFRCLILLFSISFFSFRSHAAVDSALRSREVQLLTHAKSIHELNSSHEDVQSTENLRRICEFQLQNKKIPSSCFVAINLEFKVGLLNKTKLESTRKWLVDNCLDRVDEAHTLVELETAKANLPGECLKQVTRRIHELKYMAVTQKPADLFRTRFE